MTEAPAPVARLEGIAHAYGRTRALDGVSLALPAGCLAGLIGPDGVGKSTLLGLLAGVRRLQSGSLEVLGGNLAQAAHRRRVCAQIAYMPQGLGRNLYPTLSVYENVDFFGRLFGQSAAERRRRIEELLAGTGLEAFAERPAGKLSGGMKQKLGLCCALIHDPELLILDEPTTGVDPLSRRRFWELIDRLRARSPGMSVVVATAYMEEAARLDWLAAMDGGRILALGAPQELLRRTGAASLEEAFTALQPSAGADRAETAEAHVREADRGPPAIVARGLTRRFGDFTAVDRVSFEIERGEIFGFLGSNGCGKTTTMKMLTGLLPASDGEAELLGQPVDAGDIDLRQRVGYMAQAFSLYEDLTVRQNLALHARLFRLPAEQVAARTADMLARFGLGTVADQLPLRLPLGLRQRLSLAVAVIHRPEMLILDEPTSGVDPAARDAFWQLLRELSRQEGVTIFVSTHFMNEAERCDRISLMHAGRVLATGTPAALREARGAESLEEAFVDYLEEADGAEPSPAEAAAPPIGAVAVQARRRPRFQALQRLWAYARREALEILRDPIRLAFALAGPALLMIAFGYGISFDVENLRYAALDRDQTAESRRYLESFEGSRYFQAAPPLASQAEMHRRLQSGELKLGIELPAGFGADLLAGRTPEIAVWVDGAMPFRAETTGGYVQGVTTAYLLELSRSELGRETALAPVTVETRFRYNQAFTSAIAITPGVIMLLLAIIPAMLTAVGVVREKELGSIVNLYATPTRRLEFLLGKQLPYLAVGLTAFATLTAMTLLLFGVPLRGSPAALLLGAFLYLGATTALGLLISAFVRSQVAALFAAAIISVVPAVNFSGLLTPVSALEGLPRWLGLAFPSAWFQSVSVGVFAKGLGAGALVADYAALVAFALVAILAAAALLPKQEA